MLHFGANREIYELSCFASLRVTQHTLPPTVFAVPSLCLCLTSPRCKSRTSSVGNPKSTSLNAPGTKARQTKISRQVQNVITISKHYNAIARTLQTSQNQIEYFLNRRKKKIRILTVAHLASRYILRTGGWPLEIPPLRPFFQVLHNIFPHPDYIKPSMKEHTPCLTQGVPRCRVSPQPISSS